MAVTQQLARISMERLERCGRDVMELDRLISFEMGQAEACIDLDWSAKGLLAGLQSVGENETSRLLSELLGDTAEVVNIDYPMGPTNHPVFSKITSANPSVVKQLAQGLSDCSGAQLETLFSHATATGLESGIDNETKAQSYYREAFATLHQFIEEAASLDQAVAAWWD